MSKNAWLTLDTIPSRLVQAIELPNDEQWCAQFLGAFLLLTEAKNWEQFGILTPDEMAQEWLEIFQNFIEGQTNMIPVGTVLEFGGETLPDGFLWCDDEEISRETYANLFAVIGIKFGDGNGTTTFNKPNRAGKVAVGLTSVWPDFDDLGKVGGEIQHTLGVAEMPSHTHLQNPHTHVQNQHTHIQDAHTHVQNAHVHDYQYSQIAQSGTNRFILNTGGASTFPSADSRTPTNQNTTPTNQNTTPTNQNTTPTNQNFGGGAAHENMPPFVIMNYIIKY